MLCQSRWPQVRIPSFTFTCLLCFYSALRTYMQVRACASLSIKYEWGSAVVTVGVLSYLWRCTFMHAFLSVPLTFRFLPPAPLRFAVYTLVQLNHWYHGKLCTFVEEWETNLMSLAILFHFLCAQHVSDINISIVRSLRLCWWITTSVVLFSVRCVLETWCGWFWVVYVLQAEAQLQPAKRMS